MYIRWINNKVLLPTTGNYIQYPVNKPNGKEHEKEYICVCVCVHVCVSEHMNHFDVHPKLTHCKSTIL